MAEHPHSDDELFSEDFDLEALDPSQLASMFSEENDAPGVELDIDDSDDSRHPLRSEPAFGPLADADHPKPLLDDSSVFDPLAPDDILRDEEPEPTPPPAQPDAKPKRQSLKESLRQARSEVTGGKDEDETHSLHTEPHVPDVGIAGPQAPAAKKPPKAASQAPPEEGKRLSFKDSLRQAKSELAGGKAKSAGDAAAPAEPKQSLKERLLARTGAGDHAASDQEDLDAPQVLLADVDEPQPAASGVLGKARAFWAEKRQMAAAADAPPAADPHAGLDLSPPSVGEKLRGRARIGETAEARSSRFAELLTPLDGAELERLQRDVQSTEPVFVRVEKARALAQTRQWVGFIVGLLAVLMFALSAGQDYLLERLPNAPQPAWVPAEAAGDPAGAALFVLGLILPLTAAVVIADTVRYAWQGLADKRFGDLLLALLGIVCALGMFKALGDAQVMAAVGFGLAWLVGKAVIRLAFRVMRRISGRGR